MALVYLKKGDTQTPNAVATKKVSQTVHPHESGQRKKGQAQRLSLEGIRMDLPMRLRTGHMLALFGVSGAQFYKLRKAGKIPEPAGYIGSGKRPTPYWLTTQVVSYI